jgi:hypothetical protein
MSADCGVLPALPIATAPARRPAAAATATASASAAPCGRPLESSDDAVSAATTAKAPWAKLTTRVTRWMTTRPLPIRA